MAVIDIQIDDNACVGCSLCAEVCSTDVFKFDEEERLPKVEKPKECFGCLSCSEICPATAIQHNGIEAVQSFYHDPYALQLASKLGTQPREFNVVSDEESMTKALEDLGIRLISVASVLKKTLGQSLPAVGTMAGRSLATQLPRYQQPQSMEEALQLTKDMFSPAWNFSFNQSDDKLSVTIQDCFVRELCHKEGIALGGDFCILFYNYLTGYLGKMSGVRVRFLSPKPDQKKCVYEFRIYASES